MEIVTPLEFITSEYNHAIANIFHQDIVFSV